jgi:hypothetical protein
MFGMADFRGSKTGSKPDRLFVLNASKRSNWAPASFIVSKPAKLALFAHLNSRNGFLHRFKTVPPPIETHASGMQKVDFCTRQPDIRCFTFSRRWAQIAILQPVRALWDLDLDASKILAEIARGGAGSETGAAYQVRGDVQQEALATSLPDALIVTAAKSAAGGN